MFFILLGASELLLEYFHRVKLDEPFTPDMQAILCDLLGLCMKGFAIDSFIEPTKNLLLKLTNVPLALFSKDFQPKQVVLVVVHTQKSN